MAVTTLAAGPRSLVLSPPTVVPTKSAPTPATTSHLSPEQAPSRNTGPFDRANVRLELSQLATISTSGPSMASATHSTSRSWQWRLLVAQEVHLSPCLKFWTLSCQKHESRIHLLLGRLRVWRYQTNCIHGGNWSCSWVVAKFFSFGCSRLFSCLHVT